MKQETQTTNILDDVLKSIATPMLNLYVIPQVLASIGLNMPVLTDQGIKRRISKGMKINYQDGLISLTDDRFNYLILECYGTLVDQFRIKVENLETGEESIIQL